MKRSRLVGMSHAGGYIGNIVTLCVGGFLCVSGFDGGWPSIFYLIGKNCSDETNFSKLKL